MWFRKVCHFVSYFSEPLPKASSIIYFFDILFGIKIGPERYNRRLYSWHLKGGFNAKFDARNLCISGLRPVRFLNLNSIIRIRIARIASGIC